MLKINNYLHLILKYQNLSLKLISWKKNSISIGNKRLPKIKRLKINYKLWTNNLSNSKRNRPNLTNHSSKPNKN